MGKDKIELAPEKQCTGCAACAGACGKRAISFQESAEGFLYPVIDEALCVSCRACQRACPVLSPVSAYTAGSCYAAWSLDDEIRTHSSSGGIFSELARSVLSRGGLVAGASLGATGKVHHVVIDKETSLHEIQGSKYVQSIITADVLRTIKAALKSRVVLFTGTPCQVAGVIALTGNPDNLYTMDVVCHGVPSPKWFQMIHESVRGRVKGFVRYHFRKLSTWSVCANVNVDVDGTIVNRELCGLETCYQDAFLKGFLHRENCYECRYANTSRVADISVADFWGIGSKKPITDKHKAGCSMVLVNSEKGRSLFDSIKERVYAEPRDVSETIDAGNDQLRCPSHRPDERTTFYADAYSMSLKDLIAKYGLRYNKVPSLKVRFKSYLKRLYEKHCSVGKKVSLVTVFDVANFGTYLQALATAVVLKSMGAKVEIVHYERPFKNTQLLRRNILARGAYYFYFWLRGFDGCLFTHRCRRFVAKHAKISKTYYSVSELKARPPYADVYMTGSDQVWNTDHNQGVDEAYYLGWVPDGKKKVSYAASIGQDAIPEEYKERSRELLSRYDAISVREDKAVQLLAGIGIEATQVLDPTLLLDRGGWLKYAGKRLVAEDYLLVYSVEPAEYDTKVAELARYVAREKNLKIVSVSNFGEDKHIPGCDQYFDFALPQQFLSLMAHASFVVVSSFHGTAFAINFNRQFLTITPGAFSSRIASLLELTGLGRRRVNGLSDLDGNLLQEDVDFAPVNSILAQARKDSLRFIKNNIAPW